MNNNGLDDEEVQEYLESISNDIETLRQRGTAYEIYKGVRFELSPVEIALNANNDIKRVIKLLSDYEENNLEQEN